MELYVYKCRECGQETTAFEKMSSDILKLTACQFCDRMNTLQYSRSFET